MEAIDVEISSWRVRVDRALRRATPRAPQASHAGAEAALGFEDRLVGQFGWTRSLPFEEVERWVAVLARHAGSLERGCGEAPATAPRAAPPAPGHAGFDGLSDDWHAACHAVQSGVRVVALVRHWLPIWRAERADMCAQFGEHRGVQYAAVVARRMLERMSSPPFGLFALPARPGRGEALAARLSGKLDALEASLDGAGRIFQAAGCALDAIRRRQEPGRQRMYLAEMTALTARRSAVAPADRRR